MPMSYRSYKRFFQESWLELEEEFRKENVNPQQENDVVCYLYYALAKRFKKKGLPLYLIRTEDTRYIGRRQLRADINLNDLVFVEVKMYPLRKYGKGWRKKSQNVAYHVRKLEGYKAEVESRTSALVRLPILALWFWKNEEIRTFPLEARLIDDDLNKKLEEVSEKYRDRVTIMYGPRK